MAFSAVSENSASATEFIDNTTADVFIPETWSMIAMYAREQNLVFSNLIDRQYERELKVGDKLNVPQVDNLAAQTKSANTAILYQTITETMSTITVNVHEYTAIAVEDITKVQTNRDMLKLYAGKMGYGLALAVDDALAGLVDDVDNSTGALAAEVTDANIRRARQYLRDANVPREGWSIAISPAAENDILDIEKYIRDDYTKIHGTGARETGLQQAYVTSVYGIPVYVSTNVEGSNSAGHDNAMLQKEAFALIMQQKPTSYNQFDIDYVCWKVAMVNIYGYAEMRDDHCVWMKGS